MGAYICPECGVGVLLEINCESDFVSAGDKFKGIVSSVAKVIAQNKPADLDALNECKIGDETVKQFITNNTAVIGEKFLSAGLKSTKRRVKSKPTSTWAARLAS